MPAEPDIFGSVVESESRLKSNQDLGDMVVDTVEQQTARPLHNGSKPSYHVQRERAEHRAIIMMKAAAMSNQQIADTLGKSYHMVQNLVKQPWAIEQILEEIERAGREPVMQLLKVTAMDAAKAVVDVMQSSDGKTKLNAANSILDRVFGKATTPISIESKQPSDFTDEELAKIASQAKTN